MAELVRDPIDTDGVVRTAIQPSCGAVTLFLGTTRDHHEGRRVVRLEYEAYESMALTALSTLERQACERFEVASCRIVHRLGVVPAGEASVAIIVASEHRARAFDACRWAIDELKRSAPIWKKERYSDGEGEWVEGTPLV